MQAIRVITGCAASGVHLEAGRVYAVPSEVSAEDAAVLVRMGRAQEAQPERRPRPRKLDEQEA